MKKIVSCVLATVLSVSVSLAQHSKTPKPPTPEQHLKQLGEHLGKELSLSEVQKQNLVNAYESFFNKLHQSAGKELNEGTPPPPPPPVAKEVMDKLVQERNSELKSFLSKEQFEKFESLEKNRQDGKHIPPPPPLTPAAPGTPPPPPTPAVPNVPATTPAPNTPPIPPTPHTPLTTPIIDASYLSV